jgi:hypothetical protein
MDLESLGENDLTIHIRSGDLFDGDGVNWTYIIPPLYYYVTIIETGNYKNIYLICEDTKNPCVNKLLELYPSIHFSMNDISDDIKLIMRSTNVVCSYGSFVPALLNMTEYTKKLYIPSYFKQFIHLSLFNPRIEVIQIDLDEYKNEIGSWRNTARDKNMMITYKMNL